MGQRPPAQPTGGAPTPAPVRPRWGYKTSLWQVRQPAFWFFMVLLGLSFLVVLVEQTTFASLAPGGWLLSWILVIVYAVPVIVLVYALDLYEREPASLIMGALLWGGVAAIAMAGIANGGWSEVISALTSPEFAQRWTAALVAPGVEETLKAAGVVLIYLIARHEVDDIMDGFVYGAMVGLGFAVVEDVFYFVAVFGGTPGAVLTGFFVRVLAAGLYSHVLWTGLTGIGVGYFVSRRREASVGKRLSVAAGLFLLAILGHFVWNSPLLDLFPDLPLQGTDYLQVIVATAAKGLPFLLFIGLMIWLARRREHRWLAEALATEVSREGLTPEEMATLATPKSRRRTRREMAARGGPLAAATLKRLQKEQVNLAMIRTRVHEDEHPDLVRQRLYCRQLRDWLLTYTPARGSGPYTVPRGAPLRPSDD
jgi:RsiW-degrading membrane proteinase PrsW (M82 family)